MSGTACPGTHTHTQTHAHTVHNSINIKSPRSSHKPKLTSDSCRTIESSQNVPDHRKLSENKIQYRMSLSPAYVIDSIKEVVKQMGW